MELPVDSITRQFLREHADDTACRTIAWWQAVLYLSVVGAGLLLLLYRWDCFLSLFMPVTALVYFSVIGLKMTAVGLGVSRRGVARVSPAQLRALHDEDLPVYTILVPLYREANVAPKLIRNLAGFDYPRERLDIKLLLEADDDDTCSAIDAAELPPCFEVIRVPPSHPRTKPKACNHGLARARGDIVVIYDAEDRPEPDQLKKVVAVLGAVPEHVACVQASLNFYNPRQNLLTRWFSIEYTGMFDFFLPGLQCLGLPIPLGGTSNHFRAGALRRIGGWDPFNVTEDCDLGIRLHKLGYRTVMVDSTTYEEANSHLGNWIRQRSRWVKGFFQTHLVHMRHPVRTWRGLGPWGFFGFYTTVGGMALLLVVNPIMWFVLAVYAALLVADAAAGHNLVSVIAGGRDALRFAWQMVYLGPQEDPILSAISVAGAGISVILFATNFLFIAVNCLGCTRHRYWTLLPLALLAPVYWALMSVAAIKGFCQLFTNPFYWEKTRHGLDHDSPS